MEWNFNLTYIAAKFLSSLNLRVKVSTQILNARIIFYLSSSRVRITIEIIHDFIHPFKI